MILVAESAWHNTQSDLSKFMIAKFAQLVDRSEVITNHHSSTNGLILFEELYSVSLITLKRWKNNGRLQELLNECVNIQIKSSVINDIIINKYFRPARDDVHLWSTKKFDNKIVQNINQGALIHTSTIRPLYLKYIEKELSEIDLLSPSFNKESNRIELLLRMLVPQLVYEGHSLAYLQTLPAELIKHERQNIVEYLFSFFSFSAEKKYICFLPLTEQLNHNSLLHFLSPKTYKKHDITIEQSLAELDSQELRHEKHAITESVTDKSGITTLMVEAIEETGAGISLNDEARVFTKVEELFEKLSMPESSDEGTQKAQNVVEESPQGLRITTETAEEIKEDRNNFFAENNVEKETDVPEDGYTIEIYGKDPFSSLRNHVTVAFRKYSLEDPEADPSKLLNPFWDNPYYFDFMKNEYVRFNFEKTNDPLIPAYRSNTLSSSLAKHDIFLEAFKFENLYMFEEAIYFYNLARNVPSVENSYILLWTSLEALMGLRSEKADIEVVKANVAQSLALGSIGRRVVAFLDRLSKSTQLNKWSLEVPEHPTFTNFGLSENLLWLLDKSVAETPEDPFHILKKDPLLCKNYLEFSGKMKKVLNILEIIKVSQQTISYQLDRLYLTRNLIIHSAQFGKSGDHLWLHLEWYVGKLLAQSILLINEFANDTQHRDPDPRDVVFGCLQGQYRSTIDYLERYKDHDITREHLRNSGIFRFPVLCY